MNLYESIKNNLKDYDKKLNESTSLKEWDSSRILDAAFSASEAYGEDPDWSDIIYTMIDKMSDSNFKKYLKQLGMTEDEFYEGLEYADVDSIISGLEAFLSKKDIDEICSYYEVENDDEDFDESNLISCLGITQKLNEKVNHANDDINAKIREALRSKGAAKKYADEFKQLGITVDDSPREGVILIGPNGRKLSADRLDIIGPSKPGHNDTHGSRYNSIRSKRRDIANYNKYIDENKKNIEELKNMGHDDIIRKYPEKSTEEALKAHEDRIASEENSLAHNKRWRSEVQKGINKERKYRSQGHDKVVSDNTIDRKSTSADKIDYKGYLDSKDDQDYKTYQRWGNRKLTPGQKTREEFKNAKSDVNNTYYWNDQARRDLENKKIDSKAIEARKKEIEEEYKKKMDDEVNSMLQKKSDADASYKEHKQTYKNNVKALNDFRAKHNLPTKDEDSFEDYIEKRAQSRY